MAAPSTVNASGDFQVTVGGSPAGEAALRMQNATSGSLAMAGRVWWPTGDPVAKKFRGQASGSTLDLKIVSRNALRGTVDGSPLELARAVLRPIPPAEMAQSEGERSRNVHSSSVGSP